MRSSGDPAGHLALLAILLVLVDQDLSRDDVRVGPPPRDDRRCEPLVLENRLIALPANPRLAQSAMSRFSRTSGSQRRSRSEEHTSELQSLAYLVCRLLL